MKFDGKRYYRTIYSPSSLKNYKREYRCVGCLGPMNGANAFSGSFYCYDCIRKFK